jgi:hypothetical protein
MKTTVEISDVLFERAREAARERGTTLRALIEAGLSKVLAAPKSGSKRPAQRDLSFGNADRVLDLPLEELRSEREFDVVAGELVKRATPS